MLDVLAQTLPFVAVIGPGWAAFAVFDVAPAAAGVMVVAAALPVAGNDYILAQSYAVAPQRAAASILVSTILSVGTLTLTLVLALTGGAR